MSKTAAFIEHIADRRLGEHKGARRIWLEGQRLLRSGFAQGTRYAVTPTDDGALVLRLSPRGSHAVSHKQGRPVVDLLTHALGDVERVQVHFQDRQVLVTLHPLDQATRARLRRLNARLAAGEPLRLGSLSHGAGVAAEALLRGLGSARLAFANDIDGRYLEQSLGHGPLAQGGMSIEADLGDIDPSVLPQVDVLEAGLPCVAASRAGRSKKHLTRPEQDAQVADLAAAFCEVVRATQPSMIVLENVPEYADSASADLIRRRLERWGYVLHERTIDGAAWSLEARTRWVLVAVTRGLDVDLGALDGGARPATLAAVLDSRTPSTAWRSFSHLATKQTRDAAKGSKFQQRVLGPEATSVPTLRRGYQKGGSTDPRLAHPTRKGLSRLFSPAEHARIKGIPSTLVRGASDKLAHEILGQSVISPAFVALGTRLGAALA